MDKTIEELFKQKNSDILRDKLGYDVDNNAHSLQLTVENKIKLITSTVKIKINTLLRENGIEYDVKTLTDLFLGYCEDIMSLVNVILNKRKNLLSESIICDNPSKIENLRSIIDQIFAQLQPELEKGLDDIVHMKIRNDFLSRFVLKEEDQNEKVIMLLKRYDSELYRNVNDAICERNTSLFNVIKETNEKVGELDKKTTGKKIEKK